MFTIRANYNDSFEVNAPIAKVREFFSDVRNFVELMPNIESLNFTADNTARWTIRAQISVIGSMSQSFNVELAENNEDRIEWIPKSGETDNLLRYSAEFQEQSPQKTLVRFTQMVELRRNAAKDFHFLAGLAGEKRVSAGMQDEVAGMLKTFIDRTKLKLEK